MPQTPAKVSKPRYYTWTVFALKNEFLTEDMYLRRLPNGHSPEKHILNIPAAQNAVLYVKKTFESPPGWAKLFTGIAQPTLAVRAKTASALMVIETANGKFAISFGYGRSLLNTDAWEQEFGLKVVLNNIDANGVKQIQLSAFDALLQSKQAQAVRKARIDEFGLDVEQDVIRSLVGVPTDASLGRQFGGRDSLRISTQTSLQNIPAMLDRVLADSAKEDYLKTFSWIGRMKEVRDKNLRVSLDEQMLEQLKAHNLERLWIAPPSYQDWNAGHSFVIYGLDEPQDDLRLTQILTEWASNGKLDELTTDGLKTRRVVVSDDSEQEVANWPFYRTIYCELDRGSDTYLLNNGLWYRINQDYLKEVNADIDAFPQSALQLPDYNDPSEEDYNRRVSESSSDFALMDQRFIELKTRGLTKVELCDLFSSDRKFIHVKRYSGSSELSHLFAQGIVPAGLFLNDREFRKEVNARLQSSHQLQNPMDDIDPRQYEIVYAIVSKSNNDLRLPFFSKVMLRHARRILEGFRYNVSLCKIRNIYSPSPESASVDEEMAIAES